ncbi:RluA family pseudouridine synthase [Kangiella sp. HZ709]|uniref:RluA family pseudouridine synthase n=1 Tax=Kangiella sp. HZ709 TaxID=2666328 RepID=UPI0012B00FA9|nr:RNA pseudouridine synthase [Kangiella sp. HZ709]MRX27861.1 RNA pseudouridine synthase [Kangiella sp. HZ709]
MVSDTKNNIIELHIDILEDYIENNLSVLDLLTNRCTLSKQKLKDAMAKGAVWLTATKDSAKAKPVRRKNAKLKAGNQLYLYYNPQVLQQISSLPILIADEVDYSIWNKPYGVWSQGSKWGDHCSMGRLVEQYFEFNRQAFVVHRLDRAANGLMLIAHNKKTAHKFAKLFAERRVEKSYQALVNGHFEKNQIITIPIDDKPAISHVSLMTYNKEKQVSLLEVAIETGRKHQIRKHLASIGMPIIGDRLYGKAKEEDIDLQLTSYKLCFECPITGIRKEYRRKDLKSVSRFRGNGH